MSENKAPSFEEIMEAWRINCRETLCEKCKFNDNTIPCDQLYIYTVLTGEMKLTDSFKKEEPKPESNLPAWCRVGQWVTDSREQTCLGVIESIQGRFISVDWKRNPYEFKTGIGPLETVKPVRFRPYTFEEAKGLLGKMMEYQCRDGETVICLISSVTSNPFQPGYEVMIDHWKQEAFIDAGATIDGIPLGVPEVDEEAMKGGEDGQA